MKTFIPTSLKTRVTLFTLLIFVLGIWTLSIYGARKLRNDMMTQIGERQMATATLVAHQINYDVELRLQSLQFVANEMVAAHFADPGLAQRHIEERPLLLRDFQAGVYVVNADGIVIAATPEEIPRIGMNYADRGYVTADARAKVGQPVVSRVLGSPIIPMSAPIRDSRGRVIGAVVGVIDLNKPNFLDSITANRFGRTGYYVLQDQRSRTIITSSGKARVMEKQPPPGVNPLIDHHLAGWEETGITVNRFGVEVLASSRNIPLAGWSVVASLPTEEAFAAVHNLEQHLFVAAALMSLLAGALMAWLLRRELRPLFDTIAQLGVLARSDQPPQPLTVGKDNEIGALITGFNDLLLALRRQGVSLNESEQRWKFAIEGNGDGLWDWNIAEGTVYFSDQWKRMLGFEPGKSAATSPNGKSACIPTTRTRSCAPWKRTSAAKPRCTSTSTACCARKTATSGSSTAAWWCNVMPTARRCARSARIPTSANAKARKPTRQCRTGFWSCLPKAARWNRP